MCVLCSVVAKRDGTADESIHQRDAPWDFNIPASDWIRLCRRNMTSRRLPVFRKDNLVTVCFCFADFGGTFCHTFET